MAKLSKDLSAGNLHPRETIFASGTLGALNAEIIIPCDGAATVTMDVRGSFNLQLTIEATVDGTNWLQIPIRPVWLPAGGTFEYRLLALAVVGTYTGSCLGFRQLRARCSNYTSGAATVALTATTAPLDQSLAGMVTANAGTAIGASGAAVTLTLAAAGQGLRHYLTYLSINRFAAATLTAAATPVTVTTTNIPGSMAFSFAADALAQGQIDRWREDFAYPLASSNQNTATTIVCPATTGVIWRATAGFYVAP